MSSLLNLNSALAEQATALALELQLGLKDGEGRLQHCPLTLVPWQLDDIQWQQALQVAQAMGQRIQQLTAEPALLQAALQPIVAGTSLPARLWQVLQRVPAAQRRARPVHLVRVDLLLDQQARWKLVEANTIAAGMGPFSAGLTVLQQTLWPDLQRAGWVDTTPEWRDNRVTDALAEALLQAAQTIAQGTGVTTPTVAFVVEPQEDNIFDQRKIAHALQRKGARVVRLTLAQLAQQWRRTPDHRLEVNGVGPVHALYFRTGYNLNDYRDDTGQVEPGLQLRAELETLQVALAPTIPLQLASAKAVQVYWFEQNALDDATIALATPQYFARDPRLPRPLDLERWLLKSQGEGGGNVVQGEQIAARLVQLSATEQQDWLLMEKIPVAPRAGVIPVLRQGQIHMTQHLLSELGLFLAGDRMQPAGFLLRSKPVQALETGVHRGGGMIDTVAQAL